MGFILYAVKNEIKESLYITSNLLIPKDEYTALPAVKILYLDINIFLIGLHIKLKQSKLNSRGFMVAILFTLKLLCKQIFKIIL